GADAGETARTAGRGGIAIAVAKVSFICFGFAQQLVLVRLLGTNGYGAVSVVLAIVSPVNNVMVGSAIQGVPHAVSSVPPERAGEAFRRTFTIHAIGTLVVSTAFALSAELVARLWGAPHVTTPLRLVSIVVLMYGLYGPMIGSLNGRRRFIDQAGLDIFYG